MSYVAPVTLTREEQQALLRVSEAHPRDHLLLSLALGTGLRLAELLGLDQADLYRGEQPRRRVWVRREIAKGGRAGHVFLPAALGPKLLAHRAYQQTRGEKGPVFCSQGGRRLSMRRAQLIYRAWQLEAGFDRLYPFHALRHTAVTNVYRASRDLFLAQRFARHASPLTTTAYTHPGDEELMAGVEGIAC